MAASTKLSGSRLAVVALAIVLAHAPGATAQPERPDMSGFQAEELVAAGACETLVFDRSRVEITGTYDLDHGSLLQVRCVLELQNMYEEYWLVADGVARRLLFDFTTGLLTQWVYGTGGNFQREGGDLTFFVKDGPANCGDFFNFQLSEDRFVLREWRHRDCPGGDDFDWEAWDDALPQEQWPLQEPRSFRITYQ